MLMIFAITLISYKVLYQLKANESLLYIPELFKKGGVYSFKIKNNVANSMHVNIELKDNIKKQEMIDLCNIKHKTFLSKNFHSIQFHNGQGEISGKINKDGYYVAIFKTCEINKNDSTIEITYTNSETKSKIQECYRMIISIACIMALFFILWIINLCLFFTIHNGIHFLMTVSFAFFLTEKILHIIDYKSRYQTDKILTITIVRCVFIGLSRFTFFLSNFLLGFGFEINYCKPHFIYFIISLILSSLYTINNLLNNLAYAMAFFWLNIFIGVFLIWHQSFHKKSSKAESIQLIGTLLFFTYASSYFISFIVLLDSKSLRDYLIINIVQSLIMGLIGFKYKLTKETKKDYRFYYVYSIYNYELDELSENAESKALISLRDYAFENSDFKSFTILDNVVSIGIYAFNNSTKLEEIKFSNQSNLKIIEKCAFSNCPIQHITIPASVEKLGENVFCNCNKLESVNFHVQSELTVIENQTFCNSSIKYLYIPSKVEKLKEKWCAGTPNLFNIIVDVYNTHFIYYDYTFILGKINLNYDNYEILYFARRDVKIAEIPFYIKTIAAYAFENCYKLRKLIFSPFSQLQIINNYAFSNSNISEISIPSSVKKLGDGAFHKTYCLTKITFPIDSKLSIIRNNAFQYSNIERIEIPSSVIQINEYAFDNCKYIKYVIFSYNSNLRTIRKYAFANSSLRSFSVPSSVIEIQESCFQNCTQLYLFEINEQSQLCSFDINWFIFSPSVSIFIPLNLSEMLICQL